MWGHALWPVCSVVAAEAVNNPACTAIASKYITAVMGAVVDMNPLYAVRCHRASKRLARSPLPSKAQGSGRLSFRPRPF